MEGHGSDLSYTGKKPETATERRPLNWYGLTESLPISGRAVRQDFYTGCDLMYATGAVYSKYGMY